MSLDRIRNFQIRQERRRRIQRIPLMRLRDRQNPVDWYNAVDFKKRYHLFKETAIFVVSLISHELSADLKRGVYIPPIVQFLAVLRFYCTGNFQISNGDLHQVCQPTISNFVKRVSRLLARLRSRFVNFPTHQSAATYRQQFFQIAGFPGVVGAIDCTHVKITSPGGEEPELFRNRKGVFSINVQAICDSELNFTNVVARWYCSAHDSRILENSSIFHELETGNAPGLLLEDGGYSLFPFLMTPFEPPRTPAERRYNTSQIKTRNTVERAFGVLKRRFPCLNMMRLKLNTTLAVIVATVVLHNISRKRCDIYLKDSWDPEDDENEPPMSSATVRGKIVRATLVENYFS